METPSAVTFLSNDIGEMRNSCFMVVAPMKCYVTIWEESTAKTKNDSGIMEWWKLGKKDKETHITSDNKMTKL